MITWLIELFLNALDPTDREAVRGDLAESGRTGIDALRDVVGLWIRRQIGLWREGPPWAVLFGLVLPFGLLLGAVALCTPDTRTLFNWKYGGSLDLSVSDDPSYPMMMASWFLVLSSWSWSVGFAIGSVSRRAAPFHALLFGAALLAGEFVRVPLALRSKDFPDYAAAFEGFSYRLVLAVAAQMLFVLLPSIWGMRRGLELRTLTPAIRTTVTVATALSLIFIAIQICAWLEVPPAYHYSLIWDSWAGELFQLVALWPIGYSITRIAGRSYRRAIA